MKDVPRRDFRWINSLRLTGWLCTAVQIGDPADDVIGRGGQMARCSAAPLESDGFPILALCNRCTWWVYSAPWSHKSPDILDVVTSKLTYSPPTAIREPPERGGNLWFRLHPASYITWDQSDFLGMAHLTACAQCVIAVPSRISDGTGEWWCISSSLR